LVAACSTAAVDEGGESSDASTPDTASSAAGDSNGSDVDGTDSATGTPTGPATLEPVTVAVLYPDVSVAAEFGFAEEIADLGPAFEAVMADANARGGIAGHPIDIQLVEFDLLVAGDSVRACLTATQDLGAFVVLGTNGVFGDPISCVTEQNETFMITDDGAPEEFYDRADGRLVTLLPNKTETQVAIIEAFRTELEAAPFAVFSSFDTGGDNVTVERHLLPYLAEEQLEPAAVVVLDGDADVAASQIPIEIERLRDAGVETIVSTAGFFSTGAFAQALAAADVDVTWIGSDAAGFASDLYATQMEPTQLDGARGVTVRTFGWQGAGIDEPVRRVDCRERVGELLGIEIGPDSLDVTAAIPACNFADLLVAAGELVEGDLDTASLSAAFQRLDTIELAEFGAVGFGPDDFTGAQAAREVVWSLDCMCWSSVGDFEPVYDT